MKSIKGKIFEFLVFQFFRIFNQFQQCRFYKKSSELFKKKLTFSLEIVKNFFKEICFNQFFFFLSWLRARIRFQLVWLQLSTSLILQCDCSLILEMVINNEFLIIIIFTKTSFTVKNQYRLNIKYRGYC